MSDTFVASVRNPQAKKKQAEKIERHFDKKIKERGLTAVDECGLTAPEPKPSILDGNAPTDEELLANEMAMQADQELLNKLLDTDEPLKLAHEELTKLNFLNSQLKVRIDSLMSEKNEAITLCKKLQKQLDKVSKK